jgi:ubiquitin-like modifier-activating enzyme ATG7
MATVIPHQIRGFIASFNSVQLVGQAFPHCVACSAPVIEEFADEGPEVVFRVRSLWSLRLVAHA